MRKSIVAGNWKMNKTHSEAEALFNDLKGAEAEIPQGVEVVIAPPSIYLSGFKEQTGSKVQLSVQDCSEHASPGAFTGEFSAEMAASAGAKFAILGHSERREYHGETDEKVSVKIKNCNAAGLTPIYCCGEKLDEREAGTHVRVVASQIKTALSGFDASELKSLVVAYEPVWAIGTGKTATSDQAQEMHAEIRKILADLFDQSFADSVRILYGGSCKPSNAAEIFAGKDVDGGLIGGAALNAADFMAIVQAAG